MKLVPIPIENLPQTEWAWRPFVEGIAKRGRCHAAQRLADVYGGLVHLLLVWDEEAKVPEGLGGVTFMQRGDDKIGRLVWVTGRDRKQWVHLLSDVEAFCRSAGCKGMEAIARPGWSPVLKSSGYRLTHVQYDKDFT